MLTTPEVAARLGVTVTRVQQMITAGRLPAEKLGRDYFIKEEDLKLVADRKPGRPKSSTPAPKLTTGPARAVNGPSTAKKKSSRK
ncbi:MAG: helix-turn-helix domain-containing protein [Pyrinomonadaceae bacterium]